MSPDTEPGEDAPTAAAVEKAWMQCADRLRQFDRDMVDAWKEDIDGLLVFVRAFYYYRVLLSTELL